MYAYDLRWWNCYHSKVQNGWTSSLEAVRRYAVNHIPVVRGMGFSRREGVITRNGRNSGDHAIQLARHLGYNRLLLIGYDAQDTGGRSHCHGDHPKECNGKRNHQRWIEGFRALARTADIDIVNCTIETAIDCFPRMDLEGAIHVR